MISHAGQPSLSDRALLRLHVEAVWGVRLPHVEEQVADVMLLPDSPRPRGCSAPLC